MLENWSIELNRSPYHFDSDIQDASFFPTSLAGSRLLPQSKLADEREPERGDRGVRERRGKERRAPWNPAAASSPAAAAAPTSS